MRFARLHARCLAIAACACVIILLWRCLISPARVLGRLLILPIGQGASIVSALGLSWQHNPTVFSYKEYEDYGSTLGTNATHAAQLRAGVIKGKMESPLFDTEGWARDYVRVLKQAAATAASAAAAAAQK